MENIDTNHFKIGVVLVTYNRLDCLKIALEAYDSQTVPPDVIYVVDNHSNEDTKEYLGKWKNKQEVYKKKVIRLKENMGGSGGFYTGIKQAVQDDVDWIWVADDDAYPQKETIEILRKKIQKYGIASDKKIAAICGEVIKDDTPDQFHRKRLIDNESEFREDNVPLIEYKNEVFEIDLFSYVGSAMSIKALKAVGITDKSYFIYYDDSEHSLRLRRYGKILCCPEIKILHDTGVTAKKKQTKKNNYWREYYSARNKLNLISKHSASKNTLKKAKREYEIIMVKKFLKLDFKLAKCFWDAVHDYKRNMGKNANYLP